MGEIKILKDGNENKNKDNSCRDFRAYETAFVWNAKPWSLVEISHVSEYVYLSVGAVKVGGEKWRLRLEHLYYL